MKSTSIKKSILSFVLVILILLASVSEAFATGVPWRRGSADDKYKWNLEDIYGNIDELNLDYQKIQDEYIPGILVFKGSLSNAAKVLECLSLRENITIPMNKIDVYTILKADENQADSSAKELRSKAEALLSEVKAAISFIQSELLQQPKEVINGYMNDSSLADYRYYFEMLLKFKDHTLSKEEEELLAATGEVTGFPIDIYAKITTADMTFPKIIDDSGNEVQLSENVYSSILESPNRDYRTRGFEAVYGAYKKSANSIAAALNAEVKENVTYAKIRKYNSALEASLSRDDMPAVVFDNLIKSVNDNTGYLHKYVDLRKKVLGLDKVHQYDMYVPLYDSYNPSISYEQAQNIIKNGLEPLGSEYQNMLGTAFDGRWIDVFPAENKANDSYTYYTYGAHPYIYMNYSGSFYDVLNLAWSTGFALNGYYTCSSQKSMNSDLHNSASGIGSWTNYILIHKYLINNAGNDDEKLYYLYQLTEQIRNYIYTGVMYTEFEKAIYERAEKGETLTADTCNEIMRGLMTKYFGENFEVDELAQIWWSRNGSIFNNFNSYKEIVAVAASNEIVRNVLEGRDADKYLEFLKSGESLSPIDTIKLAGVDMNSTQAMDNLLKDFGNLVDQMQAILESKAEPKPYK